MGTHGRDGSALLSGQQLWSQVLLPSGFFSTDTKASSRDGAKERSRA